MDSESLNVDKLTETPTFEKVFGIQQGGVQQLIDSDSSLDEMLGQKVETDIQMVKLMMEHLQ